MKEGPTYSALLRHPIFTLGLFALLLTYSSGFLSQELSENYYLNHPYTPDPVGNMLNHVKVHEQLENNSRMAVIADQLQTNFNSPFRTIPLIIFSQDALIDPWGHMLTTLPMLFFFLIFLGHFVYHRWNKHIGIAAAIMLLFATLRVLYAPYFGLSSFILDLAAGLPLAVAGISLVNWHTSRSQKWLNYFAIFLSFAILSRYIVCVYAFVLFAPVLAHSLFKLYRQHKSFIPVLRSLITPFCIIAVLSAYFLIKHFQHNYEYYSYWASLKQVTMNFGLKDSSVSFLMTWLTFFGLFHVIAMIIMIAVGVYFLLSRLKENSSHVLISFWLFAALPLYWILVLGTNGYVVGAAFLAAFPIMFCFLLNPLILRNGNKKILTVTAVVLIGLSLYSLNRSHSRILNENAHPTTLEKDQKALQLKLAEILPKNSDFRLANIITDKYLNYGIFLENCYRGGSMPRVAFDSIESNPIENMNSASNFLLVFDDSTSLLDKNPEWKKVDSIQTITYSTVAIYLKQK